MRVTILRAFLEQITRCEIKAAGAADLGLKGSNGLRRAHQIQAEFWRIEVDDALIQHRPGSWCRCGRRLLSRRCLAQHWNQTSQERAHYDCFPKHIPSVLH